MQRISADCPQFAEIRALRSYRRSILVAPQLIGVSFPFQTKRPGTGDLIVPVTLSPSNEKSTSIMPSGWGSADLIFFSLPGLGAIFTLEKFGASGFMPASPVRMK